MSRWFRHYAGMMRDEKLVRVALQAKQSVERVLWIWGAILESAAEINDGGRFDLDVSETAYFLRADEADISRVVECLRELGRVHDNCVAKWDARQFKSDVSTDRVRNHRQQRTENKGQLRNGKPRKRNAAVTAVKRFSNAPETETEKEKKTDKDTASAVSTANGKYAFESGVIRLSEKDLRTWKGSFAHLDLEAELVGMSEWAGQQGQKWFFAVSGALAKKNREAKHRLDCARAGPDRPLTPDGNPWPEGII